MSKLGMFNKIIVSILLILFTINSFTFNMYYPFGHLDLFPSAFILIEIIKISSILLLPLAIYYNHKVSRNIAKIIYPIFSLLSFIYIDTYTSMNKLNLPFINSNNLDATTQNIYNSINLFMPEKVIYFLFIFINIFIFISSLIIFIEDKFDESDLYSFKFLPLILLSVIPLNIFTNYVNTLSPEIINFITFNNFTIWHFLMFFLLIVVTLLAYKYLKKFDQSKQLLYLRALTIIMFIHFFSKNSMLVGDGYNIYNSIFASIPLFICDIGKYIVLIAIFTNKKVFYDIAYFVHSAGALTVFFYFGKEGTHNYGTILNYSFLYFTLTHLLLFILSVLPVMLKITTFKLKDVKIPIVYYGIVILVSTFTSVGITNFMAGVKDVNNSSLPFIYEPNYAFTQICPLPVSFPTFMNFKIGICEVNMFYEIVLYIAYIVIFFTFFIFQYYAPKLVNKVKIKYFMKIK